MDGQDQAYAEPLEGLEQDEDFAVATLGRYLLLVWRKRVTADGAAAAERALTRLYATRPHARLGFVTLIEDGCALSADAAVRDTMARMLQHHNYVLGAAAVAYERAGFVSAIVRSVITAINLASRAVFPSRVTDRLADAIEFTTSALDDATPAHRHALRVALDGMRGEPFAPAPRPRLTQRLQAFVRRPSRGPS